MSVSLLVILVNFLNYAQTDVTLIHLLSSSFNCLLHGTLFMTDNGHPLSRIFSA